MQVELISNTTLTIQPNLTYQLIIFIIINYGSNPIRLALEIIAIITLASLEP